MSVTGERGYRFREREPIERDREKLREVERQAERERER